ncbi:MAG TPA: FecR domain-containing protein [Thermoanaerobaculia bacterium]
MAKKRSKAVQGADVDWYLISIDRLKQVGLVVLILLLSAAGYFFWQKEKGNPRSNAESALADARQALNALASSKDFNVHRTEFDRAQRKLDDANKLYTSTKYVEAQGAAVESQTISRGALSGDRENDAQFLTVEGDVRFQKGGSGDFKPAESRAPLFNGDWVKTGDRASAELIFANGSLYTIGSNALLEIYSQVTPGSNKKTNEVKMQVGSVEVATTDDQSSVRTPGTRVVVSSESSTQVGVDRNQQTAVVATRGSASVTSSAGGEEIKLNSGEKVSASAAGQVSNVKKLTMPPAILSPADNQVFQMTGDLRVQFTWDKEPTATAYVLQVSRSRLFSSLEINSRRQSTTANAKVTSEGAFYWRVASIGSDGDTGPFSSFRRFRVSGGNRGGQSSVTADREPPKLQLNKPYSIGGPFFMIEGTTESGATVFINEEEVDVESNGHFKKLVSFSKTGANAVVVKAIDAAGNQTVKSETVFVEE